MTLNIFEKNIGVSVLKFSAPRLSVIRKKEIF